MIRINIIGCISQKGELIGHESKKNFAKAATKVLHQVELHVLNENAAAPTKGENSKLGIGKKIKLTYYSTTKRIGF